MDSINPATKGTKILFVPVIPAKAGIQEKQLVMDSGSPLRYGRNDVLLIAGLIINLILYPLINPRSKGNGRQPGHAPHP